LNRGLKENRPRVGIVIVNYINYSDTINYINKFILLQNDIETDIVIVDNASPNESITVLKETYRSMSEISILEYPQNKGYATGNNFGIKFLEGRNCDYILISNSDIELDDDHLLIKMIHKYRLLKDVAFISPVMITENHICSEWSAWKFPVKLKEIISSTYLLSMLSRLYLNSFIYKITPGDDEALKVDCISGSFFLGASDIFKRIGYFDERTFLYYEETILGLKVRNIGLSNYLIQNLFYKHQLSQTINRTLSPRAKYKILLDSKLYYWETYFGTGNLFRLIMKYLHIILIAELAMVSIFKQIKVTRN
jgi:GT2 family glycosyltransferase